MNHGLAVCSASTTPATIFGLPWVLLGVLWASVHGCGAGDPVRLDCRDPAAACPPAYACTQVDVSVWACLVVDESDGVEEDAELDATDVLDVQDVGDDQEGDGLEDLADIEDELPDVDDGALEDIDVMPEDVEDIDVLDVDDGVDEAGGDGSEDIGTDGVPLDALADGSDAEGEDIDEIEPLSVSLSVPAVILSGSVVVVATPSGGAPLLGAEFLLDGKSLHTDIIPPYTAWIDTLAHGDGPHTLVAQIADQAGQVAEDSRAVIFDNAPPQFGLLEPPADGTVFFEDGPLSLAAEVTDASGVEHVTMRANGLLVAELAQPPYEVLVPYDSIFLAKDQLPKGVFLQVSAVDALGQESQSSRTAFVHLRHLWTYSTVGEIWGAPVALPNGNLFFANNDAKTFALTVQGTVAWQGTTVGGVVTSPVVDPANGNVFVGTQEGRVHAWTQTGSASWTKNPANSPISGIEMHADWLAVSTFSSGIFTLNKANGNTVWSAPLPANVTGAPAVSADGTVYVGCHDKSLYAIQGGNVKWTVLTGGEVWSQPTIGPEGRVYFGSNDGWLYAVSPSGIVLWEKELKGEIWGRGLLDAEGKLYVATTFKRLFKVNTTIGGAIEWEVDLKAGVTYSAPALDANGNLYIGTTKGGADAATLVALASSTGTRIFSSAATDTIHGTPLVIGDRVFFGSTDRSLRAIWRAGMQLGSP